MNGNILPHLSRKTTIGGVFSVFAMILSSSLVISEFMAYRSVRVQSSMAVDSERAFLEKRKVAIHLNVTFDKIPCELLNFDANDVMGNRDVEAKGHLFKQPIAILDNRAISEISQDAVSEASRPPLGFQFAWSGGNFHTAGYPAYNVDAVKQKIGVEGCRLWGSVTVNRAPGSLHVSGGFLDGMKTQATHTIHHFSFGNDAEKTEPSEIPTEMAAAIKPLDGVRSDETASLFEYFLKVVPSRFSTLKGEERKFFQFSVAENAGLNGFMSSVYFRYDFAAVVVEWRETSESLAEFGVRVLSIVGGLVGVIGLLHAVVVDSVEVLRHKKAQMNKLR